MYFTIKTEEQAINSRKAKDDAETIEAMVYHLIRFCADTKLYPEIITKVTSTLTVFTEIRDRIESALDTYRNRDKR